MVCRAPVLADHAFIIKRGCFGVRSGASADAVSAPEAPKVKRGCFGLRSGASADAVSAPEAPKVKRGCFGLRSGASADAVSAPASWHSASGADQHPRRCMALQVPTSTRADQT
ncbi:MAG: hypothetical protein C0511_16845 [Hyphomicrobium sp.]|nr:hypothetical protein [Hyphomicrobium sp.]